MTETSIWEGNARCPGGCSVRGGMWIGPCVVMDHDEHCAWVRANRTNWPEDGRCSRGRLWCTCSAHIGSWVRS